MFNFYSLSIVSATLAAAISLCLFGYPQIYFAMFAVEGDESTFFIGRRLAALFLGFTLLSYTARHATHSTARQAICIGLGVSMCCMAGLGLFEVARGFAAAGTLVAVLVELAVAAAYLGIWFANRSVSSAEKLKS